MRLGRYHFMAGDRHCQCSWPDPTHGSASHSTMVVWMELHVLLSGSQSGGKATTETQRHPTNVSVAGERPRGLAEREQRVI